MPKQPFNKADKIIKKKALISTHQLMHYNLFDIVYLPLYHPVLKGKQTELCRCLFWLKLWSNE